MPSTPKAINDFLSHKICFAPAKAANADIVGLSALLTTTMPSMESTVKAMKEAGVNSKVIIGVAPVTQDYADKIGADGYAADAATACGTS